MKRKILIVEDSPTQAELLRLLLEGAGYQVDLAVNGREGLEKVNLTPPNLIISDVMMPEMDGYALCQAVKSAERTRRIPFVLLTQRNTPQDILRGLVRGADNFIPKPFEDEYLLERVKRIFDHLEFRQKGQLEVEVTLRVGDRQVVISPDKQQIIELLFATFEDVCRLNNELLDAKRELEDYATNLEVKVRERTSALQRSKGRLEILHKIDRAILAAQSPEAIAEAAADHIRHLVPCEFASIAVLNRAAGEVRVLACHGPDESVAGTGVRLSLEKWAMAEGFHQGRILAVEDVLRLPADSPQAPTLLGEGVRSYLRVPLLAQGDLIGCLNLGRSGVGAFPEDAVEIAREVADQLAVAIQQARLHERIQRHAAILEERVQERTQELASANRQLQDASRHKSEFLANMSHELRTPLNSILGFSQLLLEQAKDLLSDRQIRFLKNIYSSGEHLLRLINDILDLSKVEAGKITLQPDSLEVAVVLEDILVIARGLANKKGQTIQPAIAPDLPPLWADLVRFKQILFNLLSNAVKFTPEGGTIRVTARRLLADGRMGAEAQGSGGESAPQPPGTSAPRQFLEIALTDTGAGIKAEDLPRLFQEFVQLETTQAQHHEGTGLGLALTRRLVELHGGRIWAESEGEGKGSTFTVVLPLRGPGG